MAAILTGADRRVLCNLRKRDIRIFTENDRWSGTVYLDDRKNATRSRTVAIADELSRRLFELAATRLPGERVFSISYSQVDFLWKSARRKAGLTHVRLKDLRHTFAILCHTAGIELNVVKAGMGHQRLSTTTRYTDHDVAFSSENASAIEGLLKTG